MCTTAPVNKVDQRGVMRPQGQNCDSGAFELELQAQTNPFTVNSLSDGPVSACTYANCTLRSAVAAANALGSSATINLGAPGTIALSGAKMALTHDLNIVGPTKTTVMLDLTNQPELFTTSFEANVTLSNVTIQNASPADQQITINNQGTLTLNGVTFEDNHSPDGLFFLNNGTLNISNSTLTDNEGLLIDTSGFVNISASTVASNESEGTLLSVSGITTVSNSTFANNTQGGAVLAGDGTLTILNSTFAQNNNSFGQGDDVQGSRVTVTNSIFASPYSCAGAITDGGANIEDGDTCGLDTTKGSLVNTDPLLDPNGLQNNGGPTVTIALQAGSPAINAGIDSVCQGAPVNGVDQRGAARSKGPHCDVGAVEAGIANPPPACEGAPKTPQLLKPGQGSLVEPKQVLLKWQKMRCAAYYDVIVKLVKPGKPKQGLKTDRVRARYKIPILKESKTYQWKVRACNARGCSAWTAPSIFQTASPKPRSTP